MSDLICTNCEDPEEYKIQGEPLSYCYCSFVVEIEDRQLDRIEKILEAEIAHVSSPMMVDREYLDGLEMAIELIKGEQK